VGTRLVPLDGARALQVQGARTGLVATYRKRRDGTMLVDSKQHAKTLIAEGLATPATAAGPSAHLRGYHCPDCGRRNYFKTCGACGSADGTRES
jgi:hypothetical protein